MASTGADYRATPITIRKTRDLNLVCGISSDIKVGLPAMVKKERNE